MQAPIGKPVAQPLGHRDDVGGDALGRREPASSPQRPMPVCTSSIHSRAPCAIADLPGPREIAGRGARRRRSRPGSAPAQRPPPSRRRRRPGPPRPRRERRSLRPAAARTASRYFGLWVSAKRTQRAPVEGALRRDDLASGRSCRVILNAASLASVPELVKKTRAPRRRRSSRRAGRRVRPGLGWRRSWTRGPSVAICPVIADSTVGWA